MGKGLSGKWSRKHDHCQKCLMTNDPHIARGLCKNCYRPVKKIQHTENCPAFVDPKEPCLPNCLEFQAHSTPPTNRLQKRTRRRKAEPGPNGHHPTTEDLEEGATVGNPGSDLKLIFEGLQAKFNALQSQNLALARRNARLEMLALEILCRCPEPIKPGVREVSRDCQVHYMKHFV